MKVLLDTCVIIDVLQARTPFNTAGEQLFLQSAAKSVKGCVTAKSLTDIYYLTRREMQSTAQAKQVISKLTSLFTILDTTASDIEHALIDETPDFEDAVMIQTACRQDVDAIITRNIKDYQHSPLPIYTPDEALKHLVN